MRTTARGVAAILLALPLLALLAGGHVPAAGAVAPCSSGLVALTFDDGPDAGQTPRLVAMLDDLGVPATFFMVGERVATAPAAARLVAAHGHQVANHSYAHRMMTSQGDAEIRATLAATDRRLRAAGVTPGRLMRPPYGAMDARVERVIRGAGYTPVLWDVDPRDWEGDSATTIARRILAQLRPDRRNVVLQHDGIRNSPSSISAVPIVVREARRRGFCFADLGPDGRPTPPVPRARLRAGGADEGRAVRAVVRLDRPTSRPTSVLLRTVAGSAGAGDFTSVRMRVRFPVGATRAVATVPTLRDGLDEPRERFRVRLSEPRGLAVARARDRAAIRDLDPAPYVDGVGASVVEPAQGETVAPVRLELARASGRRVLLEVTTVAGSADASDVVPVTATVAIAPGELAAIVPVRIRADAVEEGTEQLVLRITGATHARIRSRDAVITIEPPPPA